MNSCRIWLVMTAAMVVMWQSVSFASENIKITMGSWTFEEKSAKNLNFELMLTENGVGLHATADKVTLAEPIGQLNNVSLKCTELQLLSNQYACKKGALKFNHIEIGSQKISFSVKAQPEKNSYDLKVKGLSLAEADISFVAKLKNKSGRYY